MPWWLVGCLVGGLFGCHLTFGHLDVIWTFRHLDVIWNLEIGHWTFGCHLDIGYFVVIGHWTFGCHLDIGYLVVIWRYLLLIIWRHGCVPINANSWTQSGFDFLLENTFHFLSSNYFSPQPIF